MRKQGGQILDEPIWFGSCQLELQPVADLLMQIEFGDGVVEAVAHIFHIEIGLFVEFVVGEVVNEKLFRVLDLYLWHCR